MNFISYAQNNEDVILWRALSHVENGIYIDVGANDPVQDSVTKAFYDRGWHGINLEPVGEWHQKLVEQRIRDINLKVAAGDIEGFTTFFEIVETGLSTTNQAYAERHFNEQGYQVNELKIPIRTLNNILQENHLPKIHFLKIDVEGSEASVLKGIDFSNIRPWILLIEATKPQTQILDHHRWESLVIDNGYKFVYFDGLNRFYVANEHLDLADAFSAPPNPWDRYERVSEYKLRQSEYKLRQECNTLKTTHESLKAQIEVLRSEYEVLQSDHREAILQASAQANEATSKIQELQTQLTKQIAYTQHIDTLLRDLVNSRSVRLTAPLREIGQLLRKTKKLPKRSLHKIAQTAAEQPQLRQAAKSLVNRYPKLKYRLNHLMAEERNDLPLVRQQLTHTDLSPRATRVLNDLRKVIE